MVYYRSFVIALLLALATTGCITRNKERTSGPIIDTPTPSATPHRKIGNPYKVAGVWYTPKEETQYDKVGISSWYGPKFHGRLTSNGEIFDMNRLTAAHPTLPLPSLIRVTNLDNGKKIVVRLNDRGPFAHGRILDMSRAAADKIGFKEHGLATVRVEYLGPASLEEAITALGEPESYADGTYAMSRYEIASDNNERADTIRIRIRTGPEIQLARHDETPGYLSAENMEDARRSVMRTEEFVEERKVNPRQDYAEQGADDGTSKKLAFLGNVQRFSLPKLGRIGKNSTDEAISQEKVISNPRPVQNARSHPNSGMTKKWLVQVGAFSSLANAATVVKKLDNALPVRTEQIRGKNGSHIYRVRLGPFADRQEAVRAQSVAKTHGFLDTRVIKP